MRGSWEAGAGDEVNNSRKLLSSHKTKGGVGATGVQGPGSAPGTWNHDKPMGRAGAAEEAQLLLESHPKAEDGGTMPGFPHSILFPAPPIGQT